MTEESNVPDVCQFVRTIYFLERRKFMLERCGKDTNRGLDGKTEPAWDGGPNARGTKKQAIWPRLAKFVLDNKLDPVMFIQIVFSASLGNQPPGPDMFISKRALDLYRNNESFLVEKVRIYFDHSLREFSFKWRVKKESNRENDLELKLILSDPALNVSAIYRYCLAIVVKRPDLAVSYYDDAIQEYTFNEGAFETVLGKHLTDGFRQDARKLRNVMLGVKT